MGEKLVIGPINRGLRTDRLPFVIDNDSFPTLINAYQWRGRVKRKRGTSTLTRLSRTQSISSSLSGGSYTIPNTPVVIGSVSITDTTTGYLYTDSYDLNGTLRVTATITGATKATQCVLTANNNFSSGDSVFISNVGGMTQLNGNTYTIVTATSTHITLNVNSTGFTNYTTGGIVQDRTLVGGTVNYLTGVVTITGGGSDSITGTYSYYPCLPVMGWEDVFFQSNTYPGTIAFDTTYSYSVSSAFPYTTTDIGFFKNPVSGTYSGYTAKSTLTPFTWNGQNYQQFYTTNYQNAFWATNGINIPYVGTTVNISMQFAPASTISAATVTSNTTLQMTITTCPLVIGDFVFLNEWTDSTTPANAAAINFQTGYVTAASDPGGTNTITIKSPNATFPYNSGSPDTIAPGIVQYLTNLSTPTKDCIRWYDGTGWVNFTPPISQNPYVVADAPALQYYLVSARLIVPFKDFLLFFGPVIQSSNPAMTPIYLQDTVIYSQNGTAYYTASFTGDILAASTVFNALLVPPNQTAAPYAYFEDQTGFGGFASAGIQQEITTVAPNEDALIVGFNNSIQQKLIFSNSNVLPFAFYTVNAELGSSSTFSTVIMDEGVITRGPKGFVITTQTQCRRIDMDILEQVFQISNGNNGAERFCAARDFINEWVYFTYPANNVSYVFPNQTLQYNYRDDSWAIFNETYTTYGLSRLTTGYTWATIGTKFATWGEWNEPWNAGSSTVLQPTVIGGNQQGFAMQRDVGTGEGASLFIQAISGSVITSPNHCLNQGDYIMITGCLGTIGTYINNMVFSVASPSTNSFTLNPNLTGTGTYIGGGLITRMYVPQIYSKQFPVAWADSRKTRIGVQQYMFTTTAMSQIQLLIFLSQNDDYAYNNTANGSLIYSTTLYTCPESTNLGLTPLNTNLQMFTDVASGSSPQNQTWHRINTSLIGDTVQFGFTMSDAQMRQVTDSGVPINAFSEIEFHAAILDLSPSMLLA
jgi:hypothetical protein